MSAATKSKNLSTSEIDELHSWIEERFADFGAFKCDVVRAVAHSVISQIAAGNLFDARLGIAKLGNHAEAFTKKLHELDIDPNRWESW